MAGEWVTERFGRMARLVRDGVQPHDVRGLPYIALEHIGEGTLALTGVGVAEDATSTKSRFARGDILFGKLRPYFRKVVRAPFDGICSTDIWVVRPQSGVDAEFLFYLMASQLFIEPVVRASEGTKMPRAKWEYAASLDLPLPPLPEQRAIAHILGTLDDKIELNRRMSETLEQMARALFKSWFVDFEPVRAKMEGRWRRGESLPGLPAHLYDLFPDRFVDSELGEIPQGWEVGRLENLVGLLGGYAFKSKDWREHGVPVVKIGSVKPGIVDLSQVSYVSTRVAEEAKRFRLSPGDLLIGMTGYVGEVGLVPPTDNPPLLNQRVGKFLLETPEMLGLLYCFTRRSEFKQQVEAMAHGTAQANVSAESILAIPIIIPPKALLNLFNQNCHPIIKQILKSHAQSSTLAALRNALLPKLISGEIRVKDAERFLKERGL